MSRAISRRIRSQYGDRPAPPGQTPERWPDQAATVDLAKSLALSARFSHD